MLIKPPEEISFVTFNQNKNDYKLYLISDGSLCVRPLTKLLSVKYCISYLNLPVHPIQPGYYPPHSLTHHQHHHPGASSPARSSAPHIISNLVAQSLSGHAQLTIIKSLPELNTLHRPLLDSESYSCSVLLEFVASSIPPPVFFLLFFSFSFRVFAPMLYSLLIKKQTMNHGSSN